MLNSSRGLLTCRVNRTMMNDQIKGMSDFDVFADQINGLPQL